MPVDVKELLKYSIDSKASDLHLSTGSIPMVRIDGLMKPLKLSHLTNEDMKSIKNQILNKNQQDILDDKLEIDLITKDSKIFMNNKENKIKIISKN